MNNILLIFICISAYHQLKSCCGAGIQPELSHATKRILQCAIHEGLLQARSAQKFQRDYYLSKVIFVPALGAYARLLNDVAKYGLTELNEISPLMIEHGIAYNARLNTHDELTAIYRHNRFQQHSGLPHEQRVGNWVMYLHAAKIALLKMQQEVVPDLVIREAIKQIELCKQFRSLALDNQAVTISNEHSIKIGGTLYSYCSILRVVEDNDSETFKVIFNGYK